MSEPKSGAATLADINAEIERLTTERDAYESRLNNPAEKIASSYTATAAPRSRSGAMAPARILAD